MIPRDWDEQRDWVLNHPLEAADIVAAALKVADAWNDAGPHAEYHRMAQGRLRETWPTLSDAVEQLARHDRRH